MMSFWQSGCALAVVVPLGLLALRAFRWRASAREPRRIGSWCLAALALLALAGSGWLLTHSHDDSFTGLDNMAYRKMARAFGDGRGLFDPDPVLPTLPPALRRTVLYRSGSQARPTRDLSFQLDAPDGRATRPFFMPTLPLAAAGLPWLAPDLLPPLLASLGWCLLLLAGAAAGGGWGLGVAVALALATPWPLWFSRGFYPDGSGSLILGGLIAAVAIRPLDRAVPRLVAGFALGFSAALHPTLLLVALPLAGVLMLQRPRVRESVPLAGGCLLGLLPFWWMTRAICQPYGDWTRIDRLVKLLGATREHALLATTLFLVTLLACGALALGYYPAARARLRRLDARLRPWGWAAVSLAPLLLIACLPGSPGATLREGARAVWTGIRVPGALLLLGGGAAVLRQGRPARERILLAVLAWLSLFFLFLKGLEVPAGIWSLRRFLPVILPLIALLAAPLAAACASLRTTARRAGAVALLLIAGTANLARWPAAFLQVNEAGATDWTTRVAQPFGPDRLVVFDYFPHSVPYAGIPRTRVLGLGETTRAQWPELAGWLAGVARTSEVWIATSYMPAGIEENLRLEPVLAVTGRFPVVKSRHFLPADRGERLVSHAFLKAVPVTADTPPALQEKVLDGGPLGLRGPWGAVRAHGMWTRQGSAIIGPYPAAGTVVRFEAEVEWTPPKPAWEQQRLFVVPPWGGEPLVCTVTSGVSTVSGRWMVPPVAERTPTGCYRFSAETPYDPRVYGQRGYDVDLGVLLRRVTIRVL